MCKYILKTMVMEIMSFVNHLLSLLQVYAIYRFISTNLPRSRCKQGSIRFRWADQKHSAYHTSHFGNQFIFFFIVLIHQPDCSCVAKEPISAKVVPASPCFFWVCMLILYGFSLLIAILNIVRMINLKSDFHSKCHGCFYLINRCAQTERLVWPLCVHPLLFKSV